jgi:replicative DNA helicase
LSSIPHSLEAEQALLGALIFNNRLYDEIESSLQDVHFYIPFHRAVFDTIENLIIKGWEASPITIRETMKEKSQFGNQEDLMENLAAMLESGGNTTNIKALREIILQSYLQRQLMEIGSGLNDEAQTQENINDTNELINKVEGDLFNLSESGEGNKKGIQNLKKPLQMVIHQAEEAKKNKSEVTGVSTGFLDLDKLLGGWHDSDLVILAARPAMGKTSFALNIAEIAARNSMNGDRLGRPVGFFSLEMSADQLAGRILSSATGITSTALQRGDIKDNDFDRLISQANALNDMPIYIDDTASLHINMLRSRARRMVRQHNVGMIVVDYLQLLRGNGNGFNRVQEITDISMSLKGIAKELNIPVIALSQLSRAVEGRDNKRPMLSDLRDSGSIEQDADLVIFLYREDYYLEKQVGGDETDETFAATRERLEKVKGQAEVIISKNRKGPTSTVHLQFHGPTTTFHNLDKTQYNDDTGNF